MAERFEKRADAMRIYQIMGGLQVELVIDKPEIIVSIDLGLEEMRQVREALDLAISLEKMHAALKSATERRNGFAAKHSGAVRSTAPTKSQKEARA